MNSIESTGNKRRYDDEEEFPEETEIEESKVDNRFSQFSEGNQILSSHQISSYLHKDTQMNPEELNEQITMLQKAIIQEQSCPDILPFDSTLYGDLASILEYQVSSNSRKSPKLFIGPTFGENGSDIW